MNQDANEMLRWLHTWETSGTFFSFCTRKGDQFRAFFAERGSKSNHVLTLLHGFPTSSADWAKVAVPLSDTFRILAPDFLGFGFSDKPQKHRYSIHEQADLIEAIWKHTGVVRTGLVAHDYATSVAQELLARQMEGKLATQIEGIMFLNGSMFSHLHRPLLIQKLLHNPLTGPLTTFLVTEKSFAKNMRKIFSSEHPLTDDDLFGFWQVVNRHFGNRIYHRLIHYMSDRKRFASRWESNLKNTTLPITFTWGMQDPVSGSHVMKYVKSQLPQARFNEWSDVGHYPQTEVPERVAAAILAAFA